MLQLAQQQPTQGLATLLPELFAHSPAEVGQKMPLELALRASVASQASLADSLASLLSVALE